MWVTDLRGFGTWSQPQSTWSDDSSLTLASVEALCRHGWDLGAQIDAFLRWLGTRRGARTGRCSTSATRPGPRSPAIASTATPVGVAAPASRCPQGRARSPSASPEWSAADLAALSGAQRRLCRLHPVRCRLAPPAPCHLCRCRPRAVNSGATPTPPPPSRRLGGPARWIQVHTAALDRRHRTTRRCTRPGRMLRRCVPGGMAMSALATSALPTVRHEPFIDGAAPCWQACDRPSRRGCARPSSAPR